MSEARQVNGLPWGSAAVGTATWSGVRLCQLLQQLGVEPGQEAKHVQFVGLDAGPEGAHTLRLTFSQASGRLSFMFAMRCWLSADACALTYAAARAARGHCWCVEEQGVVSPLPPPLLLLTHMRRGHCQANCRAIILDNPAHLQVRTMAPQCPLARH